MSVNNKTRIQGIILLIVGGILLGIHFSGKAVSNNNLIFGFGIGCICGGGASFLGTFFFNKGKFKENSEIQNNDERLNQIWDKAGHSAYNFSYLILLIMVVILSFTDLSSMTVIFALLVIMPLLHIGFTFYYNKRF